jgi:hypothetical protein
MNKEEITTLLLSKERCWMQLRCGMNVAEIHMDCLPGDPTALVTCYWDGQEKGKSCQYLSPESISLLIKEFVVNGFRISRYP